MEPKDSARNSKNQTNSEALPSNMFDSNAEDASSSSSDSSYTELRHTLGDSVPLETIIRRERRKKAAAKFFKDNANFTNYRLECYNRDEEPESNLSYNSLEEYHKEAQKILKKIKDEEI